MPLNNREVREVGDEVLFEYHCNESHSSGDAPIWYRSHQSVTIIGPASHGDNAVDAELLEAIGHTRQQRAEAQDNLTYMVRFKDGLEWCVFEDELLDNITEYERANPPAQPVV